MKAPLGPSLIKDFTMPHDQAPCLHNLPSMNGEFSRMEPYLYLMCGAGVALATGNWLKEWP